MICLTCKAAIERYMYIIHKNDIVSDIHIIWNQLLLTNAMSENTHESENMINLMTVVFWHTPIMHGHYLLSIWYT